MLNKIIAPGSYKYEAPCVSQIKMPSRGLVGDDLGTFIKRAGYKMADDVRNLKFAAGEVPVHLLAVGATEYYGPNRNGDAFDEAICRLFHNTFVKHARWYHNHANKDKSKSYGVIKHSAYNEDMHRIELIAALNGTKEAAERNGGLVANEELEKLAAGDDIPVSMACRVPFDICSGCGNKAKTRAEYCKGEDQGGHCKEGGCATRLGQVNDNGHHLHVKNTEPDYFDLSKVFRGADRIAFTLGEIEKAAAAGGITVGGAELAEKLGVGYPFGLFVDTVSGPQVRAMLKLAGELSKFEMSSTAEGNKYAGAFSHAMLPAVPLNGLSSAESKQSLYKAMAMCKIALPLRDFLYMHHTQDMNKLPALTANVQKQLPYIYNRMIEDPEGLEADIRKGTYKAAACASHAALDFAGGLVVDYKLDKNSVQRRAWRAAMHGLVPHAGKEGSVKDAGEGGEYAKLAREGGEYAKLAREYALYKLAFLDELRETDNFNLTCDLTIRQNHIT